LIYDYLLRLGFFYILPGCISEGDTREEVIENTRDAIRGWIDVSKQCGDIISPDRRIYERLINFVKI